MELYLDGILPTNSGVRVTLTSNYSNKAIWTNKTATATIYDEWYKLAVTNDNYQNKDVEGYYTLKVEYQYLSNWIVLNEYLVKCINTNNELNTPDAYFSDNESNEQVIYYQG